MSSTVGIIILLVIAFVSANIPWLSERFLFILTPPKKQKKVWMRLLEWLLLYFLIGAIAMGMEKRFYGQLHVQNWEFYVITAALFMLFALPGVIYRYQLRKILLRGK